ncbi:hypothetical protein [Actinokineospora pegani]|uniref:hypothetical protein n=1 Tax=Actinokineospora pegani TaxID=2654637 RepID=UPI0012E99F08|nr:hypothetical protein [Actinokineospora pegani]
MQTVSPESFARAETFVWSAARVLDRHRHAHLFADGPAAPVLAALAAYRNPDGGYGHALEPDGRGPGSQPITTLTALHVLHETGAAPDGVADYLDSITAPDGGLPFVHPNAADYPRAPWWQIADEYTGELLTTANLAGALWRAGVTHPWLDRAAEFCWPRLESITATHPYEAMGAIRFLDSTPDRDRAEPLARRLGALVRDSGHVRVGDSGAPADGYAADEVKHPHDYAVTPDSLARHWFTDEEFEHSLDHLVTAQREDGSWRVDWPTWTPVTELEWAGMHTVDTLAQLRLFGRLAG